MSNTPDYVSTFPALREESTGKVGFHRLGCVTARVCENWMRLCHLLLPGSLKYGRKRSHSKQAMREEFTVLLAHDSETQDQGSHGIL